MKKIVSLVCVAALAVSMLAGCSSKKEETKAAEESGKLVMATEAGFAPYEYTEDGKTVVGVDVDIANEIAKAMGKELEIQNMGPTSSMVIPSLWGLGFQHMTLGGTQTFVYSWGIKDVSFALGGFKNITHTCIRTV